MNNCIDIINCNTVENVFECLSRFNSGEDHLTLRAYGGNIVKGIEIARILNHKDVGINIQKSSLDSIPINGIEVPMLEIPLKSIDTKLDKKEVNDAEELVKNFGDCNFINYSTYHLLFDRCLKEYGSLSIKTRDQMENAIPLLEIKEGQETRSFKIFPAKNLDKKDRIREDEVINTLYRVGMILPGKWKEIGNRLSKYDDVILGLDTNILYRCAVTRHLMPIVSLIEPKEFTHTPNWILLVIPSTVMYELEESANIRDNRGLLLHKGRMGFRALQEIMNLSENIDIPGISLIIHGETNPVLDMKNIMFGIRKDILKFSWEMKHGGDAKNFKPPKKSSSGDMTIRYQFKKFLNQIDFHKGTFFLTADKSNSALAQAEGLCPIYLPYPNVLHDKMGHLTPTKIFSDINKNGKDISIDVPIGDIIYEMAVSFGEIIISTGEYAISLECDRRGEDIGRWVHKQLRISKESLLPLLNNYRGKLNLAKAANLHKKLVKRFDGVEWLTEMGGAFKTDSIV